MSFLYNLCSSSSGNATYIGTQTEGFFIDMGTGVRSVFRFLKTGLVMPLAGLSPEVIYQAENYVIALGIRGFKRWNSTWERVYRGAELINLDEFEGMSGRELNIFKDLVTRKVISIRLPYARRSQNFPHTASFAGTCNYQEVLHDTTGNRRFLCFHVDSMEFIKINYAQLYAQIKYLLNKPGYQYWFTQSENSRIEENNEDFIFHSPEEELVLTHIRKPERFEKVHYLTVTEIAELIRERTGYQYSHGTKAQLGKVMSKHGFEFHKGKNGRRYTVFIIDTEQVKSNRLYE